MADLVHELCSVELSRQDERDQGRFRHILPHFHVLVLNIPLKTAEEKSHWTRLLPKKQLFEYALQPGKPQVPTAPEETR
jgi:hypothetical protein